MTAPIHWRCITCGETGTTTGGEQGPDAKHVRAEQHVTTTSLREWAAGGAE